MAENNKIQIPRFFYRDTQKEIEALQNKAAEMGSVKEAMKAQLAVYADRLPEGKTVDEIVEQIYETTGMFCEAEAKVTNADVRQQIEAVVGQYTEEEAVYYLSLLEVMFTAMDAGVDDRMSLMSAEDIQAEINRKLANSGEMSMAEQIDKMVDTICGDGVKAFVFAGGNAQLLEAVSAREEDGAQIVSDMLNESYAKADNYAMAACACYEQIINGKIKGVTVENAEPRIVATMVSAGLSKGTILKRLMRGEIDMDLAKDMLEHVEKAIKWVLSVLFQSFIAVTMNAVICTVIFTFVEIGTPLCTVLVTIAALISLGFGFLAEEESKEFSDVVVELAEFILSAPFKLGRFIYRKVTNQPTAQSAQTAQPAKA